MWYPSRRQEGNALILSLMLVFVLIALGTAQFSIVQKNIRQSEFFANHDDLRHYAESGAYMALHDLRCTVTGNGGKIGTAGWSPVNDIGEDGYPATFDVGEGDGIPTPGEPNLAPIAVGGPDLAGSLIVYVEDTAWTRVQRIVSTAFNREATSSIETYVTYQISYIPRAGAIYVEPNVVLDLKGNSFTVDGTDTNPDDTPGTGGDTFGISTSEGPTPGDNGDDILDQIDSSEYDQVTGLGGTPSVGETTEEFDILSLFDRFKKIKDVEVAAGTYSDPAFGDSSNYQVTYVNGDVHLSGTGYGGGVLLVDGNLEMSGSFTFEGLVIVLGDVRQTGGGSDVHIYGTLMVSQTLSVVDDPELTVTGTADLKYSSQALANAEQLLNGHPVPYTVLYWNNLR